MTRETKLGLLIGTGIILLIGIVISDQLSVVGKDGAPTAEYGMDTGVTGAGQIAGPQQPALTGLDLAPVPGSYPAGRDAVSSQVPMPGASIHIGDPAAGSTNPPQPARPFPAHSGVQSQQMDPLPGAALVQQWGNPVPAMSVQEQRHSAESTPLAMGPVREAGAPEIGLFDPLPRPALPQGGLSSPVIQIGQGDSGPPWHSPARSLVKVQSGDTLEALARKHMGAGRHWPEILQANSDKLKKPQDLRPGMELVIPARASDDTTRVSPAATPPDKAVGTAIRTPRTYTVQKGDTLYGIAQKELGRAGRWKEILQANKSLLKGEAGNLQPGMKLTLPTESSSSSFLPQVLSASTAAEVAIHGQGPASPTAPALIHDMPLLLDQPLDVRLTPVVKPMG